MLARSILFLLHLPQTLLDHREDHVPTDQSEQNTFQIHNGIAGDAERRIPDGM
jgi:hypothetical protein